MLRQVKRRHKWLISEIKERTWLHTPWTLKRIINEYCEQLYAHKFDNLEKIDEFIERLSLSKLTEEKNDTNRTISTKEIESVINNFPK